MKYLLLLVLLLGCAEGVKKPDNPEVIVSVPKLPPGKQKKETLTILAFGDSGTGSSDQKLVAKAMKKVCETERCSFALILGDVVYDSGLDSKYSKAKTHIELPYKDIDLTFWLMKGNHDSALYRGSNLVSYGKKNKKFRMLDNYYFVPGLPNWLKILAMDTTEDRSEQAELIEKEFCKFKGVKIIAGHYPIFSSGKHGTHSTMYRKIYPVAKKCKVDMVLTGHDHNLELSHDGYMTHVLSGAAAKIRPLGTINKHSKWAVSQLGFSTITISQYNYTVNFWDKDGNILYKYSTQVNEGWL